MDISEAVSLSGVAPSALRFYEKKGLIKPNG
ncbi:MerR family DNA-binding transcriptional regulator [Raoultella planticola]|nr:MerR family DNA-binding transcriptional regulator [Raoultella planticola]MDM9676207.1 MerR family DNA-binding transcriptional regulator [Raoultella planticola]